MKIFLLAGICLLISIISFAQTPNKTAEENLPTPTKGYYSIYKNAEKLMPERETRTAAPDSVINNVSKGYFGIASNNKKLGTKYKAYSNRKPAVTKGYYSIGNNSSKLK